MFSLFRKDLTAEKDRHVQRLRKEYDPNNPRLLGYSLKTDQLGGAIWSATDELITAKRKHFLLLEHAFFHGFVKVRFGIGQK